MVTRAFNKRENFSQRQMRQFAFLRAFNEVAPFTRNKRDILREKYKLHFTAIAGALYDNTTQSGCAFEELEKAFDQHYIRRYKVDESRLTRLGHSQLAVYEAFLAQE